MITETAVATFLCKHGVRAVVEAVWQEHEDGSVALLDHPLMHVSVGTDYLCLGRWSDANHTTMQIKDYKANADGLRRIVAAIKEQAA